MPDYMVSRTAGDDSSAGDLHLVRSDDTTHTLCGEQTGDAVPSPGGDASPCPRCARRLVKRVFERLDGGRRFDIVVD